MSTESKITFSKKEIIGWIVAVLSVVLIMSTQGNALWTHEKQPIFLAITVFFIVLIAFELVHNLIIALLLPFSYMFFGVAKGAQVFSAWSGTIPWVVLAGFIIANVLSRTGLLNRVVYWTLSKTGCNYRGIVFGFGVVGVITELLTSNKSYLIMPAIAYAVCVSLGLEKSKASAGIFLAAAFGACFPSCVIYAPTGIGNMLAIMTQVTPLPMTVDYVTYFIHKAPMIIFYFLILFLIPILFKPEVEFDGKDVIKKQLADLGPITKDEKYAAIVSVIFVIGLVTTKIHNIDILYIFVLWVCALFMPKVGVGTQGDLQKVNFTFILLMTGFIAIGSAASAVNIGEIVTVVLTPMLAGATNSFVSLGGAFLFGFFVNFFLTPLAAVAGLTVPLTQIGVDLGIPLIPLAYSFNAGLGELLLPYEITKYLTFYAFGMFTIKDFAKLYGVKAILSFVFLLAVMIPYWGIIGLV